MLKVQNTKIIDEENNSNAATKTCHCGQPSKRLLDGYCLSSCNIYKATVSSENGQVAYIRMTITTDTTSMTDTITIASHSTTKDMYTKLNCLETSGNVKTKIQYYIPRKTMSNQCNLRLEEKYKISQHSDENSCQLLSKRYEIRTCNHK